MKADATLSNNTSHHKIWDIINGKRFAAIFGDQDRIIRHSQINTSRNSRIGDQMVDHGHFYAVNRQFPIATCVFRTVNSIPVREKLSKYRNPHFSAFQIQESNRFLLLPWLLPSPFSPSDRRLTYVIHQLMSRRFLLPVHNCLGTLPDIPRFLLCVNPNRLHSD